MFFPHGEIHFCFSDQFSLCHCRQQLPAVLSGYPRVEGMEQLRQLCSGLRCAGRALYVSPTGKQVVRLFSKPKRMTKLGQELGRQRRILSQQDGQVRAEAPALEVPVG